MKKKLLALVLVVVLGISSVVGGTLAYLTDTGSDVNVMTLGNVDIEQLEYERYVNEDGNFETVDTSGVEPNYDINQAYKLQPFTQGKPAYPAVYTNEAGTTAWDEFQQLWNQVGAPGSNDLFDDSMKNVVDKFVFVKNTGKTDAYYRTIIAIESPEGIDSELIHANFNSNTRFAAINQSDDFTGEADKGEKSYHVGYITVDGVRYALYNMTYNQILTPDEVSRPSLLQVYLDPSATNEDCAAFGDTWEILVVSQAVQAQGFENAQTALDTAFGDVTAETAAEWFDGMITNIGATFAEAGTYAINKAIIFEDETGDNIVASAADVVVNINGGYYDAGSQRNNCAVWAYNGGVININDGTFIADGDAAPATSASHLDLIYAGQDGTINIYGGTFSLRNNNGWLLNEKDNTATITVYGGSFLNWNPANNESEGANTSFLADGYKVVTEMTSEGTWYHVVPKE